MEDNLRNNLIDKLNNNTITPEEKEELFRFYNSYQLSKEWDENTMGDFDEVKNNIFEKVNFHIRRDVKRKIYPMAFFLRIAAACLLIFFSAWFGYTFLFKPGANVVVQSGKSTKEVILPDGSKITMNINSRLTYPKVFDGKRREVEFEGEGFFEVQADVEHPFLVATPLVKIKVVGTAFNLKAYDEDPVVEASLIHGKIEVLTNKGENKLSTLAPRQKFVLEKESGKTSFEPKAATRQIEIVPIEFIDHNNNAPVDVAWKEGKFAFASSSFSDIAREMKRRYEVDIVFLNQNIAQFKYTASFEQENVEDILNALKLVKPFKYRKEGDKIVVY